jgi:hypothetical protein
LGAEAPADRCAETRGVVDALWNCAISAAAPVRVDCTIAFSLCPDAGNVRILQPPRGEDVLINAGKWRSIPGKAGSELSVDQDTEGAVMHQGRFDAN